MKAFTHTQSISAPQQRPRSLGEGEFPRLFSLQGAIILITIFATCATMVFGIWHASRESMPVHLSDAASGAELSVASAAQPTLVSATSSSRVSVIVMPKVGIDPKAPGAEKLRLEFEQIAAADGATHVRPVEGTTIIEASLTPDGVARLKATNDFDVGNNQLLSNAAK